MNTDDDVPATKPVAPTTTTRTVMRPMVPPRSASPATTTTTGEDTNDGRPTAVYVASLTWWTTDAELETILSEFGRVKSLTFFADKATGKSKGCCAVEFATADAAMGCKEKLHGRTINGKACVVTYAEIPKQQAAVVVANPNAPLPPPPDTAWKGPIPPDKPGYGGVPYNAPSIHQQQMMRQQQQHQFMMAQQMQNATPAMRAQMLQQMQQGGGVPPSGKAPPPPPPPPGVIPPKRQRKE